MMTLYGIRNCDTCRRAMRRLDDEGIEWRFHDLRRDGLDRERVDRWAAILGTDAMVNRRGQTWRRLDPQARETLSDDALRDLLVREPTLVKRPVIELADGSVHVGWTDAVRDALQGKT